MIIGIGNEYQDVHEDLYELKSDFSAWLCEKKIELSTDLKWGSLWEKIGINWRINKFMISDSLRS